MTNERWHHGNLVLAGDAAHTAHFTIGSGTKLAIEDAIGLAAALGAHGDPGTALAAYERERKAALLHHRRSQLLTRMSPAGYYRLRRTSEEFALFDRLWHWASGRRREREVRRGTSA